MSPRSSPSPRTRRSAATGGSARGSRSLRATPPTWAVPTRSTSSTGPTRSPTSSTASPTTTRAPAPSRVRARRASPASPPPRPLSAPTTRRSGSCLSVGDAEAFPRVDHRRHRLAGQQPLRAVDTAGRELDPGPHQRDLVGQRRHAGRRRDRAVQQRHHGRQHRRLAADRQRARQRGHRALAAKLPDGSATTVVPAHGFVYLASTKGLGSGGDGVKIYLPDGPSGTAGTLVDSVDLHGGTGGRRRDERLRRRRVRALPRRLRRLRLPDDQELRRLERHGLPDAGDRPERSPGAARRSSASRRPRTRRVRCPPARSSRARGPVPPTSPSRTSSARGSTSTGPEGRDISGLVFDPSDAERPLLGEEQELGLPPGEAGRPLGPRHQQRLGRRQADLLPRRARTPRRTSPTPRV